MNAWEFWREVKLKRGDINSRVRGDLTPRVLYKLNINMLMNMHHPPAEGNLYESYQTHNVL
jgi:hypothetical protein